MHRRVSPAIGERVPVFRDGLGQRPHARSGGADAERDYLPTLPADAQVCVPGLRRPLYDPPPDGTDGIAPSNRAAEAASGLGYGSGHFPRPVLPRLTETRSQAGARLFSCGGSAAGGEMPCHVAKSFCCGACGAQMWKEEQAGEERVNGARMSQAEAPGAHTLAVGCPFCVVMLIEASRGAGEWIQVLDVAEIIAERRLEGGAAEPAVV